jgi:cell division protein FtsQ
MARRKHDPTPTPGQAQALPADVRVTQTVALALWVVVALAVVLGAALWLTRTPLLPIRAIQLEGELSRNSVAGIRASALPMLQGNFIGIDLAASREAFETLPWVRHAVVRRVWPDKLAVQLEEHRAAALWQGENEESVAIDRLVNTYGEVFDASASEVEDERLPRLAGPEGSAAEMLAMLSRLQAAFELQQWRIERLALSGRGSWRAEMHSGAVVELGRGAHDEVLARAERFVRTVNDTQIVKRYRQPVAYADLRHRDGYALRLAGVTTTLAPANAGAAGPRTP